MRHRTPIILTLAEAHLLFQDPHRLLYSPCSYTTINVPFVYSQSFSQSEPVILHRTYDLSTLHSLSTLHDFSALMLSPDSRLDDQNFTTALFQSLTGKEKLQNSSFLRALRLPNQSCFIGCSSGKLIQAAKLGTTFQISPKLAESDGPV